MALKFTNRDHVHFVFKYCIYFHWLPTYIVYRYRSCIHVLYLFALAAHIHCIQFEIMYSSIVCISIGRPHIHHIQVKILLYLFPVPFHTHRYRSCISLLCLFPVFLHIYRLRSSVVSASKSPPLWVEILHLHEVYRQDITMARSYM